MSMHEDLEAMGRAIGITPEDLWRMTLIEFARLRAAHRACAMRGCAETDHDARTTGGRDDLR